MNLTDVGRFGLIVALGLLALVTFLIAGTIVGLMWVESSENRREVLVAAGIFVLVLILLWL
jgi:hypothetical protein